ncbi:MAG: chorismate synthase [Clostridiales bacterium]|nr:chorismate synthase [Clostridiales bacterium]
MNDTFGRNLRVSIFGESHGECIGATLEGLPQGLVVNEDFIRLMLTRRRPAGVISTARREEDNFIIESGVCNGVTTGEALCIKIPNKDIRPKDYKSVEYKARPSHADYVAHVRFGGGEGKSGGGHFSGRLTAALVAVGAILVYALKNKGIEIGVHISRCAGVNDRAFDKASLISDIKALQESNFPVLDNDAAEKMREKIIAARENNDSVGGILEAAIVGLDAGVGEPWFDSLEGVLSHILFSIPAVKGVEFGAGFAIADMLGSVANDELYTDGERVYTYTNNNGGINGGISNSMPVVFRCAVKPTPTIAREQRTVDLKNMCNTTIIATGRHDPCIVHRAAVVVECASAIALADMLVSRYGEEWLK